MLIDEILNMLQPYFTGTGVSIHATDGKKYNHKRIDCCLGDKRKGTLFHLWTHIKGQLKDGSYGERLDLQMFDGFPRAAFRNTIDQDDYDRNVVEVYEANGSVTFRGLSRQQVKKACEILLRFL